MLCWCRLSDDFSEELLSYDCEVMTGLSAVGKYSLVLESSRVSDLSLWYRLLGTVRLSCVKLESLSFLECVKLSSDFSGKLFVV